MVHKRVRWTKTCRWLKKSERVNQVLQLTEDGRYERQYREWVERYVNPLLQKLDLHIGDFYEDCAYHPVVCTKIDLDYHSLTGVSAVDGSTRSCSIINCGVRKLTIQEAQHIRQLWITGGQRAVMIEVEGWTPEHADAYFKEWQ